MQQGINDALAERLYLDFCEAEGGINHPVLEAWCKCEEVYGEITTDSPINELFLQAIRYVIDVCELKPGWAEDE